MPLRADLRWLSRQTLLLAVAAAMLLLVFESMPLDLALERLFYDPAQERFPWRQAWLLTDVLHSGAKYLCVMLGLTAVGVALIGVSGRLPWLPRRSAVLAAAGMLLIPLLTAWIKQVSNRHCPWDIVDFGGYAPYTGLLAAPTAGIKAGACFPAGHASAGFMWIVWGLALRPCCRRLAGRALTAGLLLGMLLGTAQMLRGAHFLSHTLWSAWLAWAITVALAGLCGVELAPRPAGAAAQGKH